MCWQRRQTQETVRDGACRHCPGIQKRRDMSLDTLCTRRTLCMGEGFLPSTLAGREYLREALLVPSDVHACTQGRTPRNPQCQHMRPIGKLLRTVSHAGHGHCQTCTHWECHEPRHHVLRVQACGILSPCLGFEGILPKAPKQWIFEIVTKILEIKTGKKEKNVKRNWNL